MLPEILSNFYSCIDESILTSCITVWYGSTSAFDQFLQRVQRRSPGFQWPLCRASTTTESTGELPPPSKTSPTPSMDCSHFYPYRSVKSKTTRLKNSFCPTAIRLLNSRYEFILPLNCPYCLHFAHAYLHSFQICSVLLGDQA